MKEIRGIWFPDGDEHFAAQLAAGPLVDGRGTYQLRKYHAARSASPRRRHAVDVGGHVGLWSRVMASDFGRVTAFEPLPAHVACFRRNLAGAPNVTLHQTALGAAAGEVRMVMPADNTGHAHVAEAGETVAMATLDSFGLEDVDLLKIDVEGFEVPVLDGAAETLIRCRPVVICEQKADNAERYGRRRHDAILLLADMGWRQVVEIAGDHVMVPPPAPERGQ